MRSLTFQNLEKQKKGKSFRIPHNFQRLHQKRIERNGCVVGGFDFVYHDMFIQVNCKAYNEMYIWEGQIYWLGNPMVVFKKKSK